MIIKKIIACTMYTTLLIAMDEAQDNTTINRQENYLVEIVHKLESLSCRIHNGEVKGNEHWLTMMKHVGKIECCLELGIPKFEHERKEITDRLAVMESAIRTYFTPETQQKQEQNFCGVM